MEFISEKIESLMTKLIEYKNDLIIKLNERKITRCIWNFFNKKNRLYVLTLYLIALFIFIFTLSSNYFVIPISGDFKLQEIPFYYNGYDDWWTAITTGQFPMWDDSAFLGVNNIGANAFYYLWNIFFLPTLLVPRQLVPQMQAFLIMTKFVLAGLVMKKLLCYLGRSEQTSKIIGTAYAFSGWALYYLWFNHFLEICVLFPLVIYGIEILLKEKKTAPLVISLFLSAITNYFFFIMTCFCSVIYALFRYFQNWKSYSKKERIGVITLGIACYIVGLLMACLVLIPCFRVALQSSRAEVTSSSFTGQLLSCLTNIKDYLKVKDYSSSWKSFKELMNVCFKFSGDYSTKYYLYPLASYFFPPISCYDSTLFNNTYYDNTNCSLFIYNPLMLMVIPSIIMSFKEKRISHIIGVLGTLLMLFTPFVYYCFTGFTSVCYGRWQLFIVVIMCIYISGNFDKMRQIKRWYFDISLVFCLVNQIILICIAYKLQGTLGTNKLDERLYYAIIECVYIVVIYLYMRTMCHKNSFKVGLRWIVALEAIIVGNVLVQGQGTVTYTNLYGGYQDVQSETRLVNKIKAEDNSFYRIFNSSADRDANNMGMIEGYRGIGTFHSIYDYDLQDFIDWSRISYSYHGWSMGVHEKRANLDTFLNIKYYLLDQYDNNIPFGYQELYQDGNVVLYENQNYVNFGFAFDSLLNANNFTYYDDYTSLSGYRATIVKNEINYVRYGIVSDDDAKEIVEQYPSIEYKKSVSDYSGILYTPKISTKDIKIKKAIWDQAVQGQMDGYEDEVIYSIKDATHLLWNSEVTMDLSSYDIASGAQARGGAYVTIKARMGENLIIYLYGTNKDGEEYLLCSDNHMTHNYGKSGDWKYERGFYVNDQVTKVKIVVKDTFGTSAVLVKPDITYQYYDSYQENINKLKANELTNVVCGVNDFTFNSSYDVDKFVVLTIPYDDGWTLKATDSNGVTTQKKIYKGQGGFISFVAESGDYSYSLSYVTPGLQLGIASLGAGMFLFACLYYSIDVYYQDKKHLNEVFNIK